MRAFWWPRFERLARWFVAHEAGRRAMLADSLTEVPGEVVFGEPAGGPFTLRAKADRIDRLADGTLAVIDYKTGALPSAREQAQGLAAQLPLEAVMVQHGGFAGLAPGPVSSLEHWWLTGRGPGGEVRPIGQPPHEAAAAARAGLLRLIDAFDDPRTPYHAQPVAAAAPRYSAYAHLARVNAWATAGEEEEG